MEHSAYPHIAGYLIDCEACESQCHCDEMVAAGQATECVYHASDNPRASRAVNPHSDFRPGQRVRLRESDWQLGAGMVATEATVARVGRKYVHVRPDYQRHTYPLTPDRLTLITDA